MKKILLIALTVLLVAASTASATTIMFNNYSGRNGAEVFSSGTGAPGNLAPNKTAQCFGDYTGTVAMYETLDNTNWSPAKDANGNAITWTQSTKGIRNWSSRSIKTRAGYLKQGTGNRPVTLKINSGN